MSGELRTRLNGLCWSIEAIAWTSWCLALFILSTVGTALIVVSVGVPLLLATAYLVRPVADLHRRLVPYWDHGPEIDSPYLRDPGGGMLARLRAVFRDPARRRDWYWLLANGTVGLAVAIVAVVEAVLDLLFWWLPPNRTLRAYAALTRWLLSTSEKSRLALRVQQLTESRAETVDTQAAELRRIERDLHDGAQARLVSLGMSLALAEQQLSTDPEGVRALLAEARASSSDALAELRDLVRGIHPPVLADRGLVGALQALALAAPLPVETHVDVPARLPAPVESAAYFVVAEALTNVIKHAAAGRAAVTVGHHDGVLRLTVHDDGAGGADPAAGTGLRGIERRLSAFDGTLAITSPPGGPTELAMVLPCPNSASGSVSSWPRTSPSSATG